MPDFNATAVPYQVGTYFATSVCPQWLPTNHLLFQLANIFLFLSYMAPAGLYGLLYLRICLTVGSFFFALWGYVILCAFDTMVWNAFFTAINLVHVCVLMYVLRPVRLPPNMELVYRELFQPLKVSRQQFQPAAACVKTLRDLEPQETYSVEGVTRADCLTLVLSGRFLVSHKSRPLQIVDRLEFLDSPEWFGVCGGGDNFQVTTTAMERCRVIVWNRDKLKLTISGDSFLQAIFDNVVGKDVVRKLLFVTETTTQNGPSADSATETTKLLIQMKEAAVRGVAHGEKGEVYRKKSSEKHTEMYSDKVEGVQRAEKSEMHRSKSSEKHTETHSDKAEGIRRADKAEEHVKSSEKTSMMKMHEKLSKVPSKLSKLSSKLSSRRTSQQRLP